MRRETLTVFVFLATVSLAASNPAALEDGDGGTSASQTRTDDEAVQNRLHDLEVKYQKTGDASYLFERVLTLEEVGEYEFALEILRNHRGEFEAQDDIDGVAIVEQRLRDRLADDADSSAGGASTPSSRTDTSGSDVLGWTLTGTGTLAVAGGIVQIVAAENRAKRLRCSPAVRGPDAAGCAGVDPYPDLSRNEFDRKKAGISRQRWIGVGLTGLGVAAAGWGIYRLLDDGSTGTADGGGSGDVAVRGTAVWTPDGPRLRLDVRF